MDKLGRNYKLIVERIDGGTVTIEPPFTIDFDIVRKNFFSNNTASFRIYNLGKDNRAQIQKFHGDPGLFKKVTFLAGYGDKLSVVFYGDITLAHSERIGTNWITTVECLDSGFALSTSQISKQYSSSTPYRTIVLDIIKSIKNISIGAIGDIPGKTVRGAAFSGRAGEIVNELTGNRFFIDNGKAYVLGDNEIVAGSTLVIDSISGLLGVPKRESTFVVFDILFEPRLFIGQKISLRAGGNSQFNGEYRVDNISHRGTISDSVSGTSVTSVGCIFGEAFKEIRTELFL